MNKKLARWAVPVGAVAVAGAVLGGGPVIAAMTGAGALPPKDAKQLLADAQKAFQKPPQMSGTLVQSADLGLPELPGQAGSDAMSLLSGSNTARVWYADNQHVRVALQGNGSEENFVRNGDVAWKYNSSDNTATKYAIPADAKAKEQPKLPQDAAEEALARVDKHTKISVTDTAKVAGRDAYEVTLRPDQKGSTIGSVRLALDGEHSVPLRVQVFAKGADKPAAQVGFTKVTFTEPAAENFAFKPPEGAKVEQGKIPEGRMDHKDREDQKGGKNGAKVIGKGWTAVGSFPVGSDALGKLGENAMGDALLQAAQKTDDGRLLRTTLVNALLTDDGRLYAGAVEPELLAKAAKAG